jgi:hypothetical protein
MRVSMVLFGRCLLTAALFALALSTSLFALLCETIARASERLCCCPRDRTRGS